MGLFKKNDKPKPTPAIEYSPPEQGVPTPPKICECENCIHFKEVIKNQGVIVANQQVILDNITKLGQLMVKLATGEEETEAQEQEELSEEEIEAALSAARAKKASPPKTVIKKRS